MSCYNTAVKKTIVVTNNLPVAPVGVQAGRLVYPEIGKTRQVLKKICQDLWWVPGTDMAKNLGNIQFLNTVMLGALYATNHIGFGENLFENAIRKTVPSRFVPINIEAFKIGKTLCQSNA